MHPYKYPILLERVRMLKRSIENHNPYEPIKKTKLQKEKKPTQELKIYSNRANKKKG